MGSKTDNTTQGTEDGNSGPVLRSMETVRVTAEDALLQNCDGQCGGTCRLGHFPGFHGATNSGKLLCRVLSQGDASILHCPDSCKGSHGSGSWASVLVSVSCLFSA